MRKIPQKNPDREGMSTDFSVGTTRVNPREIIERRAEVEDWEGGSTEAVLCGDLGDADRVPSGGASVRLRGGHGKRGEGKVPRSDR